MIVHILVFSRESEFLVMPKGEGFVDTPVLRGHGS